ncbi:unnamed protein product, partial [Adineta steineri]
FVALSKSDAVQQSVADSNRVGGFIEMSDQYPVVFDIIWALSFNHDIQQQLRSNSSFIHKLSQLANESDDEQVRKTTQGILWNLEIDHQDRSISRNTDQNTFDIMISYSHKEKVLCKQLYDELTKNGYRVWIDFDQMHGNVMDAMAQAIDRSEIIIICMSEQYRRSNFCRAEAHYAFQRQRRIVPVLMQKHYKPDGWLLFLIGQLLYIDFTKYEFTRAMEMLMKELKVKNNSEDTEVNIEAEQSSIIAPALLSLIAPNPMMLPMLPKNILDWTQTQVHEWLTGNNLVQMARLLTDLNGRSLLYFDDFIRNGDRKQIVNILQEDSLRKTGQTLSLTELACFESLMESNIPSDSNTTNKKHGQETGSQTNKIDPKRPQQRQSLGTNLIDPYYAFNPDYMGGNMPNVQLYENSPTINRPSSCTCSCGDMTFGPPVSCVSAQICVAYCLQMYPGQCTLVNTFGCCGSSCQYFQSQSLENRFCACNCGGQQYFNPVDTCTSSQACLTTCLQNFPQVCIPVTTQACCGQDCKSYSQSVANACACRCQGNTYYPSPTCTNAEGCVSTCMTTYGDCTFDQTQGCCGASCSLFIPTCSCSCGPEFSTMTSVPCQGGRSCVDTCISSYGACTQDNTQACCGNDCINAFPSCTCMCGGSQFTTLAMTCGSAQQCVQACLQSVAQCNIGNTRGCCGGDCSGYIPTCRCQCGSSIYYTTSNCANAEQCTNTCISQFGYACSPTNTIGCCNGTFCTKRNRFLGVSQAYTFQISFTTIIFSMNSFLLFI